MLTIRSKKLGCIALTVCLAVSACGCKAEVDPAQAQAIQDAQAALEAEQNGTSAADEEAAAELQSLYEKLHLQEIPAEDPVRADADFELPAIAQLLAYKATYPQAFEDVDADENAWYQYEEDFWIVAAMGLIAVPPEGAKDKYGYTHVKKDVLLDYALALIPVYAETGEVPSMDNIYGVSGNPRSDVIDLDGIGFSVKAEIVLLGRVTGSADVVMRVHLEDAEGLMSPNEWDVVLQDWPDGASHALPLQVLSISPVK